MIGLLIGLLTSSGVTIALAQLGAVHLELVRNQDELAEDIKAKQNELGNLQDQLEKAGENLQSKEARAKVLDEQHGRQEKQVTELSAKIRASSEEQKRVEEDLRKAREQLEAINRDAKAKADELKELPTLRNIVSVLSKKTASDNQGLLLQSAIDKFRKDHQLEDTSDLEKAYDKGYAFRIKEETEPYRLWNEAESWIGSVNSPVVKQEGRLELSEKIIKNCAEIRAKHVRSLGAKKILENDGDVLDACERVLESSKSEDRKADAGKIKEWLQKRPNRSK